VAGLIIVLLADERFSDGVVYTVVVLLSTSMGAQLAAIRSLKVPDLVTVALSLTITGVLTERGSGWSEPAMMRRGLAFVAFAMGVLAGALLVLYVSVVAALAFGLGIIVVTAIAAHVVSDTEEGWSAPRGV